MPLNAAQAVVILLFTAFSGIFAMLLRIILPAKMVVLFISHWFWSPVMQVLGGIRVVTTGRENVSKTVPCIYVSNHASQIDIMAMVRAVTVPLFFVAKSELKKVPVLSQYITVMGMIFVDRGNKEKAMTSMREAIKRIRDGYNVITFPEGTRSKTGELMQFKRGTFVIAKEGRIPVVPVAIIGSSKVLKAGTFQLRPGTIHVRIGSPVAPEEFEHLDVESIAAFFREKVKNLMNAPR